tara:strand:+ start:859 stop:987 length:129 start_codon:yes stop_codon:yes gene_type:complete
MGLTKKNKTIRSKNKLFKLNFLVIRKWKINMNKNKGKITPKA